MNDKPPASGSGPGFLSSLGIIIIAAAVTGAAVVGMVMYERGFFQDPEQKIQEIIKESESQTQPEMIIPAFTFTDQYNVPFHSSSLEGKYWIADFGFTQCRGICPAMNNAMREVVQSMMLMPYWNDVRIIRFTVDPVNDTPEVNREYFQTNILDTFTEEEQAKIKKNWFILTGDKNQIWTLCEESFKLPVEDDPSNPAMPISHSSKFVLVGPDMQIIDYYDSLEDLQRAQLVLDINEHLADEGK